MISAIVIIVFRALLNEIQHKCQNLVQPIKMEYCASDVSLCLAFCFSVDVKFCSKTVPTVFSGEDNLTFNIGLFWVEKTFWIELNCLCKLLNFLMEISAHSSRNIVFF